MFTSSGFWDGQDHECAHESQKGGHTRRQPQAGRARGGRRELELERLRLHGHGIEMRGARGWEERLGQFGSCISVHIS